MVNRRRKGRRVEVEIESRLREEGWDTDTARGSTKFSKKVDIWGLWDVIGIKKVDGITYHIYVQGKSNRKPNLKPYEDWYKRNCDDRCFAQIWVKVDRQGFRVFDMGLGGALTL